MLRPRPDELHKRLVSLQSDEELKRKAAKAYRKHIWTQEELDAADREAKRLHKALVWE